MANILWETFWKLFGPYFVEGDDWSEPCYCRGFYKHFNSRDELVVEALATAFQDLDGWEEHIDTLTKLLQNYLSEGHRDAPGAGRALGALLGDMSRASRSAKAVYTALLKGSFAYSTGLFRQMEPLIGAPVRFSRSVQC